jgi:SAM-dependent methyltransferase
MTRNGGGAVTMPARRNGRRTTKQAIERALTAVAGRLSPVARDTILLQNRIKHGYEVGRILDAAGHAGAVCDLGGGLGVNLLTLRELGCTGRLVLIDRFEQYDEHNHMGRAQDALPVLAGHGIELVPRDFWNDWQLPLDTGSFAAATCFDVFEHLPGHPMRQLGELHRILMAGGTCMISAPNGVSLMKRLRALSGRYPYSPLPEWLEDPYIEHFREYTRAELEELLRRAGFADVRSYASAAVTNSRALHRYHRRRLSLASPRLVALWGLALFEAVAPGLRHTVYASGVRGGA